MGKQLLQPWGQGSRLEARTCNASRAEGLRSAALQDKQQRDARVAVHKARLLQQMARSALLQISALRSPSSPRSGLHLESPFPLQFA